MTKAVWKKDEEVWEVTFTDNSFRIQIYLIKFRPRFIKVLDLGYLDIRTTNFIPKKYEVKD